MTTSILMPGKNCWRKAHADHVGFLVDGADYFDAFAAAASKATKSILIVGWDFNSQTKLWCDDKKREGPAQLGDFLNGLIKRQRKLRIFIVAWDFPVIYGTDREVAPLFGPPWHHRRRIHFRFDNHFPVGGSHHQKIVVIDDAIAFAGGLDLTCGRWDTSEHLANHAGRITAGKPYPPFHDLMMAVDGEAARALADIARQRWRWATKKELKPHGVASFAWPKEIKVDVENVSVAIARTIPAYADRREVREVEAMYIDMIAAARHMIYIENQYFTSFRIGDALAARLQDDDCPDIVLVIRLASDGWLEGPTMGALRTQLLKRLQAADKNKRLRAYYPVAPDLGETCINVHAKMIAIDDEIVRIGSANLNNRSMGFDTECDLAIEAHGQARIGTAIAGFRNRLLAEHLDTTADAIAKTLAQEGSLIKTIEALRGKPRTLQEFEHLDEWSDVAISVAELCDPERPVMVEQLITQFSPDIDIKKSAPLLMKLVIAVLIFGGLFAIWRWTPLFEYVSAEAATDWAREFGGHPAAPWLVMGSYTVASFIMFPRPLLTLAAVIAFGAWLGFAYAFIGIQLAALATYAMGRSMSRDTVRRIAGPKLNRISKVLREKGLLAVIALRVIPIAPFIVVNMVIGAARVKLWHYLVGSAIGLLPGTLAATVFADQFETWLRDSGKVNWIVVAGVAIVFVVAIVLIRKWFMKSQPELAAAGGR
ncbi:MAG: VTT domain-containing protein [Burkholderiales bacterium]|nr:VTT domain-containing protein [Burkholderiales bacterium]